MSSSMHIDNKKKDILIYGKGPKQELDDTTLTAEAQYSINSSRSNRRFCLRWHYKGSNSFLFVNATKIYQFKAKDPEIKKYPLCLGNISGGFTTNKMKKKKHTKQDEMDVCLIFLLIIRLLILVLLLISVSI